MANKGKCTWLGLYERLRRQPYARVRDKEIQVKIGSRMLNGCLVFEDNGKNFYIKVEE